MKTEEILKHRKKSVTRDDGHLTLRQYINALTAFAAKHGDHLKPVILIEYDMAGVYSLDDELYLGYSDEQFEEHDDGDTVLITVSY